MNFSDVTKILQSLPTTYQRSGNDFQAWQNSLAGGITRFTESIDNTSAQMQFFEASGNWLNLWGKLLGVIRNPSESDTAYRARIVGTMLAWRGTPNGIVSYLALAMGLTATVAEAFPAVGWTLNLAPGTSLTPAQKTQLASNLAFVRPAGVPYSVRTVTNGLFLGTGNFLNTTHFPGSWLQPYTTLSSFTVPSNTNNTLPTIATTWLSDPTINA